MGVHGLWQLLHPSGRPVTLESLEGKVLAVDVSLWLHQTMKGMRDKDGNPLPNAHLQGLFSRVCKLLFYRIKPVFVFDGDVPALKKQTLIARRERKAQAEREGHEIAQKLLHNLVKSEAVKNALGDTSKTSARVPGVRKGGSNRGDRDIFELQPLHETDDIRLQMNSEAWEQEFEQQENWIREGLKVLSDVAPDSEEFKSLPMEIQHEVLNDMKERQKYHSLRQMTQMPEDSDNFSAYQLKKLMKQCNLTTEIESVRKRMAKKTVNDFQLERDEKYTGDEVEARRIVSEDASHYILIKGMSKKKQEEHAERYELESKIKKEKEDDLTKFKGALSLTTSESVTSEKEKRSTSSVGVKRSFRTAKANRFSNKKAKRRRSAREHQGNDNNKSVVPVGGSGLNNDESYLERENDQEIDSEEEKDVESVEEMSSEDEGFIEVAFDPTQMTEEDELFPASIFTPATEAVERKEPFQIKAPVVSSDVSSGLSSKRVNSVKAATDTVSSESQSTRSFEDSKERKAVRSSKVSGTRNREDESKSSCFHEESSSLPIPSNAEKRKSVLNDILSQLKKKKEEILHLSDAEESLEGNVPDPSESVSEHEKEVCEKSTTVMDHSADSSEKSIGLSYEEDGNSGPEHGNDSKLHHIDSDSEDEDLKLAIQLSLQTAEAEQETYKKKLNVDDVVQSNVRWIHKNNSEENIRQDESDKDDDSETMETALDQLEADDIERHDTHLEEEQNHDNGEKEKELSSVNKTVSGSSSTAEEGLLPMSEESIEERLQPEDFEIDTPFAFRNQCVAQDLTGELEAERNALILEQGKQARFAKSVTEQVTLEAQELLRLFGIPYIVSPMEAEAQCAYLDITEQTQGTITDDSDIWLFGGRRMYKNFFNQNKHVEFFSMDAIMSHFGLKRQQLINIALLCGSDYTEGIESVGPVRALEILGEFPGDGLSGLRDFRNWWERAKKNPLMKESSKLKSRMRNLSVIRGFPSQAVVDAYLNPVIDDSKERFTWGQPDLDLLRQFTKLKFGWSKEKSDQSLEPMMKQLMKRQSQGRIYSYFQQDTFIPAPTLKSSRLEKALLRVQEGKHDLAQDEEEEEEKTQKTKTNKRKPVEKNTKNQIEMEENYGTDLPKKKQKKKRLEKNIKRKQIDTDGTEATTKKEKLEPLPGKVKEEVILEPNDKSEDDNLPSASSKTEICSVKSASHNKQTKGKRKGNQSMREKRPLPNLTLETKRRGMRSQKHHQKKSAFSRSSICLSESSSDSESSEENISIKIEKTETVKSPQKPPRSAKMQDSKNPEGGKKMSLVKNTQGKKVEASDSLSKLSCGKSASTEANPSKDQTREKDSKESVHKSKPVKKTLSNSAGNSRTDTQTSQIKQDGDAKLNKKPRKVPMGEEVDVRGLKSVKPGREIEGKRLRDTTQEISQPVEVSHPEDKETDEKQQTLPQQVVKNPDVSLINAQTLKATLNYLNQRSHEKKQLLRSLKGGHQLNAVERRMEEEEKRERTAALIRSKKEQSNIKNQEEIQEPKQDVSFEDILGGFDAEIVKSRLGKGKTRFSQKEKTSQKLEQVEGQPKSSQRIDALKNESQPLKSSEKTARAAKRHMRMRSMSSDSSSSVDLASKQAEEKDQEKLINAEIDSKVTDQRSERSRCFDQPIREPRKSKHSTINLEDHDPQAGDKFQYQMHHMNDSRSIKGHGYIPFQQPPEKIRGLAVAGKGKGVGKNRSGRKAGKLTRMEDRSEESQMGIQVSQGVTTDQIQEHAHITVDDLGSDFSDSEF